jgi:hypothetical protein
MSEEYITGVSTAKQFFARGDGASPIKNIMTVIGRDNVKHPPGGS